MSNFKNIEIERFTHAGRTVLICQDPEPFDPRKEYENIATLVCWHRRADLGDKTITPMSAKDLRDKVKSEGETIVAILPLFLYQHSGMTMRTEPFHKSTNPANMDRFDSGQVGWAYVTREAAQKAGFPRRGVTKAKMEEVIVSEVATYDQYLTGEVYGYAILGMADEDGEDGEVIESCWGFFGDRKDVIAQAKSTAEHSEDPAVVELANELASRATYAAVGA